MTFIRENSEGEYAGSGARLYKNSPNEVVIQNGVFSRKSKSQGPPLLAGLGLSCGGDTMLFFKTSRSALSILSFLLCCPRAVCYNEEAKSVFS